MALRAFECRWMTTVARAMVPPDVLDGVTAQVDVAAAARIWSDRAPWYMNVLLRLVLWLAWLGPWWALRRMRTFGGASPAERERVLEAMVYSRVHAIRMATAFLKLAACMFVLGDERVLARIGAYDIAAARPAALRILP